MTFGEWLGQARKAHGMTYDELAIKACIAKSYAFDLEKNNCEPTIKVLFKIASAFKMPLHKIIKQIESKQ